MEIVRAAALIDAAAHAAKDVADAVECSHKRQTSSTSGTGLGHRKRGCQRVRILFVNDMNVLPMDRQYPVRPSQTFPLEKTRLVIPHSGAKRLILTLRKRDAISLRQSAAKVALALAYAFR